MEVRRERPVPIASTSAASIAKSYRAGCHDNEVLEYNLEISGGGSDALAYIRTRIAPCHLFTINNK